MEFGRKGKPGGPRCKFCKRHVRACSNNPCEEKLREKNKIWQAKGDSLISGKNVTSTVGQLSLDKPKADESSYLPPIPPHLIQNLSVRRVYTVTLEQYTKSGMVINFKLPDLSASADDPKEEQVTALLLWSAFPAAVRALELEERLCTLQNRVPLGSKFNVYVNSIENQRLFITLATKPAPILNYDYKDLLPLKTESTQIIKSNNESQHLSTESSLDSESRVNITGYSKYRYLIILDLEATCDYSPEPVVTPETAEIIEFPYVVLDTRTFQFIEEKQIYIKPDNLKGITPYCQVLTSIAQDTVSTGRTLAQAIRFFDSYVSSSLENDSFRIITDGVWDLSCQLRSEAKRKNIPLSKWFNEYFDLKEEFRKFMPFFPFGAREPSLHTMLQALRLNFVGKHHRGIDDCHSIALVVKAMMIAGHRFEKPTVIPPDYNSSSDPSFLNFTSQAATNSWKCVSCTTKFTDEYSGENPNRAVWNKPLASACRFCSSPKPLDIRQPRNCQICNRDFFFTQQEVEYFQSKRWYLPNNCAHCRHLKTRIYIGE